MLQTSIRNPATPRSHQKRTMSSNSRRTSSSHQLRSGWAASKLCRKYWPLASSKLPGRSAEDARPVVGQAPVGLGVGPDVVVAVRRVPPAERVDEPRMLVARVVGHQVHQDPDPALARRAARACRGRRASRRRGRCRGSPRRRSPSRGSASRSPATATRRRCRGAPGGRAWRRCRAGRPPRRRWSRRRSGDRSGRRRRRATSGRAHSSGWLAPWMSPRVAAVARERTETRRGGAPGVSPGTMRRPRDGAPAPSGRAGRPWSASPGSRRCPARRR